MQRNSFEEKIMVCSEKNETADLLYEALEKINLLKDNIIRVYSRKSIDDYKKQNKSFMKNSYHEILKKYED